MNNHDYIIGQMLNDEEARLQYAQFIEEDFFKCEDTKKVLRCLKKDEFSFELLMRECGQKVVCHAMGLANETIKIDWRKDGKI